MNTCYSPCSFPFLYDFNPTPYAVRKLVGAHTFHERFKKLVLSGPLEVPPLVRQLAGLSAATKTLPSGLEAKSERK